MRLRLADDTDAEAVAALINVAFRPERFFTEADRTNPAEVRQYLQKGKFLVAEDEPGLVACVYLEPRADHFYLGLLSVDPSRQRTGLGSWMMQQAEEHCRAAGARAVDLKLVNLRKELPEYYRRRGYVETGTLPWPAQVPVNQPCHFITMSKQLF
jgi:predicted N-acetyltransferase YhbS